MGATTGPNRGNTPSATVVTAQEGISHATYSLYNQAGRLGNPGSPQTPADWPGIGVMIGILALACFTTGFIIAWLLRTVFVMAQISWSQERMQRRVHYWQDQAILARSLAAGGQADPPDWSAPGIG
jgi:hypothetical protein